MRIVVASRNPVKIAATEAAFRAEFPDADLELISVDVDSGAGDQPMSDAATRKGARTRAEAASAAMPDASFWVGLEGGIEIIDGEFLASAWMVIRSADGRFGEARTPTLPLPPSVRILVRQGIELGTANDQVFATLNSKQEGGAFGLLTDGRYTREGIYAQALELALLPLCHPLYSSARPD